MNLHWLILDNVLTSNNLVYDTARLVRGGDAPGRITAASFQTLATAGYGPGQLNFSGMPKAFIYNAIQNYLLNRVQAWDGGGHLAYEGFIAEIRATVDHYTYEVTTDNFVSQVRVKWTEADTQRGSGTRDNSTTVPNSIQKNAQATAAQAKYCIKEEDMDLTVSGGGSYGVIDRTQALQAAQTYLAELINPIAPHYQYKPETSPPERTIEFTLWGYASTLNFQQDNTAIKPQRKDIGAVVKTLLQTSHNQFIATSDLTGIATVGTQVLYNTTGNWKRLQDMISELTQVGAPSFNRILFQVWEQRKPYIFVAPSSAGYFTRSDSAQVWSGQHAALYPWRVRAGQYMVAEDFPAPVLKYATVASDPRAYLIESTNYDDLTGAWDAAPQKKLDTKRFLGRLKRGTRFLKI